MTYQHPYSDYLKHILNKSPSKTCYSFSKTQRFKQQKTETLQFEPCLQANGHDYCDGKYYKMKTQSRGHNYTQNGQYSQPIFKPRNVQESFGITQEVQKILRRIDRIKYPIHQPKKYPIDVKQNRIQDEDYMCINRKFYIDITEQQNKSKFKSPKNRKNSPNRIKSEKKKNQQTRISPSYNHGKYKKECIPSPNKTFTQQLQQLSHPSKNMTNHGYYPVGIQISPSGQYTNSKIKNVMSPKFKVSPPKNSGRLNLNHVNNVTKFYEPFSQFGLYSARKKP